MKDCVATAPTPASAHAPFEPTENQCDWTATPISPVAGSRAPLEKVWTGRRGRGDCASAFRASEAANNVADAMVATVKSVSVRLIFRASSFGRIAVGIKHLFQKPSPRRGGMFIALSPLNAPSPGGAAC